VGYGRKLPASSINAKIEYAASLIQLDLLEEARKFLNLPDVKNLREAKRWHAMSNLYDFQLDRAADEFIPLLKEYDPESYDHLVIKVNLMIALLASVNHPERKKLFDRIAKEVKTAILKHQATRLKKTYESILVQAVFFANSEETLVLSEEAIESELDFFKKFTGLFHEARAKRVSRDQLNRRYRELRTLAQEQHWFEALREIDLHYSRIFRPELLQYIKMGTRYPHYQLKHLSGVIVETHYCFSRDSDLTHTPALDNKFEIKVLPDAQKLKELYRLFLREQYAPLTAHAIWVVLAKDEHFISPHSSNRVHQWVKRLKLWVKRKKIPARILVGREGYRLVPQQVLFCDTSLLQFQNPDMDLLLQVKSRFKVKELFSIHDLSSLAPDLTLRELQYRVKSYLADGVLEKTGRARRVRYALKLKEDSIA
jgi:hypothetical protein